MAKRIMSLSQIRNLPQYRGFTEEELSEVLNDINTGGIKSKIKKEIERFEKDYDLSDMTANDMSSLEELARINILLEEIDAEVREALREGDWNTFEKINRVATGLRADASRIQNDLNITRKARHGQGDGSPVEFIEEIKKRAKNFLQQRLKEIYCPLCGILVAKVWWLYEDDRQEIRCICNRLSEGFHIEPYEFTVNISGFNDINKNVDFGPPIV